MAPHDAYEGYVKRTRHLNTCTGEPTQCICPGSKNLWVLSPRRIDIEDVGKWLLFPKPDSVDRMWRLVRVATEAGRLGFAAKVAFEERDRPAIMVYMHDCNDLEKREILRDALNRELAAGGYPKFAANKFKTDEETRAGAYSSLAPASKFQNGEAPSRKCIFYSRGHCKNGDDCTFIHGDAPRAAPAAAGGRGFNPDHRRQGPRMQPRDAPAGAAARPASPDVPMLECCTCFCESPVAEGVKCKAEQEAAKHFLCRTCLNDYAKNQLAGEHANEGQLRCPFVLEVGAGRVDRKCPAPSWSSDDLKDVLEKDTFAQLVHQLHQVLQEQKEINARTRRELEEARKHAEDRQAALARQVEEAAKLHEDNQREQIRQIRLRIVEEVINLCCPRCRTVFVDYNGCDALVCSNQRCNCAFCALCLKDCERDAHAHVMQEHGEVWGTPQRFQQAHAQRRLALIQAAVTGLDGRGADFQRALLRELQADIEGVGLRPEQLRVTGREAAPQGAAGGGRMVPPQAHAAPVQAAAGRAGIPVVVALPPAFIEGCTAYISERLRRPIPPAEMARGQPVVRLLVLCDLLRLLPSISVLLPEDLAGCDDDAGNPFDRRWAPEADPFEHMYGDMRNRGTFYLSEPQRELVPPYDPAFWMYTHHCDANRGGGLCSLQFVCAVCLSHVGIGPRPGDGLQRANPAVAAALAAAFRQHFDRNGDHRALAALPGPQRKAAYDAAHGLRLQYYVFEVLRLAWELGWHADIAEALQNGNRWCLDQVQRTQGILDLSTRVDLMRAFRLTLRQVLDQRQNLLNAVPAAAAADRAPAPDAQRQERDLVGRLENINEQNFLVQLQQQLMEFQGRPLTHQQQHMGVEDLQEAIFNLMAH